jgi:hypothetical protein
MDASTLPTFTRRPVLSGRRFTMFFVGVLLASLLVGVPVVLRFEATQDRLEQVRQTWPPAAAQLDDRYSAVELYCIAQKIELPAEWKKARDGFNKNVLYDQQARFATDLESLIRRHPEIQPSATSVEAAAFHKAFESDDFLSFERNQNEVAASHSDMLGRLTDFCFRLSPPPRFDR